MTTVTVTLIWVSDEGEWETAWLAEAWDEYSIEQDSDSFAEKLEKLRATHHSVRQIRVNISADACAALFDIPAIEGEVHET